MRIHDWGVQQRVVAKDHRGRFITIPSNYPLKVQQLLKTLGKYGSSPIYSTQMHAMGCRQISVQMVDALYS